MLPQFESGSVILQAYFINSIAKMFNTYKLQKKEFRVFVQRIRNIVAYELTTVIEELSGCKHC
jgi:virulence-associated protein VapD